MRYLLSVPPHADDRKNNLAFVNLFNLKRTAGFCPMNYAIVRFDPETEQPVISSDGLLQREGRGETELLLSEVSSQMPFVWVTNC